MGVMIVVTEAAEGMLSDSFTPKAWGGPPISNQIVDILVYFTLHLKLIADSLMIHDTLITSKPLNA